MAYSTDSLTSGSITSGSTVTYSGMAAIMTDPTVTPNDLGRPMLQVYCISNGFIIKVDSTLLGEGIDSSLVFAETESDVAKQVTAIYARHKVLYSGKIKPATTASRAATSGSIAADVQSSYTYTAVQNALDKLYKPTNHGEE